MEDQGGEDAEEKRETDTEDMIHWDRVVSLASADFYKGRLTEEGMCQTVVLIPMRKGDYHGIGLMEVVWKLVTAILNLRLTASITYHEFVHGFREGLSTVTSTLEAKLIQKLAALRDEVLYVIFLDLRKVYDALDRDRYLKIMEGYGMGT